MGGGEGAGEVERRRTAGAVLGVRELIVIGSQALHASVGGGVPEEAMRSVDVYGAVFGDEEGQLADLLDGFIGEGSMFHSTFGYYAQGVVETTAVLPAGWRERLAATAALDDRVRGQVDGWIQA